MGKRSRPVKFLGFGRTTLPWHNRSVPKPDRIPVKKDRASYQQKDGKQGARALHGDKLSGKAYYFLKIPSESRIKS